MTRLSIQRNIYRNHVMKCAQCRDKDEGRPGARFCEDGYQRWLALEAERVGRARRQLRAKTHPPASRPGRVKATGGARGGRRLDTPRSLGSKRN